MDTTEELHHEIIELQCKEESLRAENTALQKAVEEQATLIQELYLEKEGEKEEEKVANYAEYVKTLQVDLKQARHQIEYYKVLAEDSQRRANRYQESLTQATKDQVAASQLEAQNEQLQRELVQHKFTIYKLRSENELAAENFARLRDRDKKALAACEIRLADLVSHACEVETESEAFSDVFTNLIDTLENENVVARSLLNDRAALLNKMEVLYSVVGLFQALSDPHRTTIGSLPPDLDALMTGACDDLHAYREIHGMLSNVGGAAQDQIRKELGGMSESAGGMLTSLHYIKRDVGAFLARLHAEPRAWFTMKAKFGSIWR
ncbi:hypothetical protein COCC4DRAFT_64364 [Bipolaris maydis ATCC 48331]|uniref:Uncharacterized protein n=2 Tax=Cochliobolus heterostrophus TaxID=5016 RepID=M2V3X8_COCH5|nr:uncharacterized protein COCC4DRAFT_64364 [Bipolaris maydis ATCC 48331]EMD94718.1 hypothetical protein COCHEDRAFT_1091138 [Bipolaris maydis C5]KAJ5029139.1 hypothetical protein J3E73DRAFT_254217 [Bipolaris maydis]ENI01570.1 hypothetical protein COCC4DRAFT_64364 [Bipolaris maydis ATCC 48331]KAJ6276243.1 hypothetical protein PSV08DRAFT_243088 [Bipolaris maydis]KAJ6287384.1 hypothetical protein J3E71DRAFT_358237 [Bipolaris maydis]